MKLNLIYTILFCFFLINLLPGQEILISKDVNVRNYFSYNIIGKINERVILYRDQGFLKELDVFDLNMKHKFKAELNLEDKKSIIQEIIPQDSFFQIIYSYSIQDSVITGIRSYNERIELLDSTSIIIKNKADIKSRFKSILSDDKKYMAIYYTDKDKSLDVTLLDLHKKEQIWSYKFIVNDINISNDFIDACLSNKGVFLVLFENDDQKLKNEGDNAKLLRITGNNADIGNINFEKYFASEWLIKIDNLNDRVYLTGLYSKKGDSRVEGVYILNRAINKLRQNENVSFLPFDEDFINEVSTNKRQNQLEFFNLNNLVLRRDGGALLFAEMNKVYNRRNPYTGAYPASRDSYVGRGWTDYYNEDVIVMAFDINDHLEWKSVLYKKQFSQDDEGIYSSYFLFKTPSRLRMLYNDEIKKNNTVSEYILDPLGNKTRNSLLSTDHQNLKLRFTGAVQISPTALIVPSETAYKMNLVKIEY